LTIRQRFFFSKAFYSDYLVLNGINKSRITVKSFGEEKPLAYGQNEASYAKNRRVEIN
jgi:peptidoglycan-associated lipoprotein